MSIDTNILTTEKAKISRTTYNSLPRDTPPVTPPHYKGHLPRGGGEAHGGVSRGEMSICVHTMTVIQVTEVQVEASF